MPVMELHPLQGEIRAGRQLHSPRKPSDDQVLQHAADWRCVAAASSPESVKQAADASLDACFSALARQEDGLQRAADGAAVATEQRLRSLAAGCRRHCAMQCWQR